MKSILCKKAKKEDKESLREIFLSYADKMLRLPYAWGGDDPLKGFDCSGLVVECLKGVGVLPYTGDWTAHALFRVLAKNTVKKPYRGCLVFFGISFEAIRHVGICLNELIMIEAGGGDRSVKTKERAIEKNAYVRIRPINIRKDLIVTVDPFLHA
jgi:cell wall-associated NlpC family hydrolase